MPFNFLRSEKNLVEFPAGNVVFKQGDQGNVMYAIVEGEVEILVGSEVVETSGPGSIFGEMAIIDERPRAATVKAKTDCVLAAIDERRFLFMVEHTPFFAIEVMRTLARRLIQADEQAWGVKNRATEVDA